MNRQQGITLIELMITLVILGVLVGLAYPAYQNYTKRAMCEDGKATLLAAASYIETERLRNGSYASATLTGTQYTQSPREGTAQFRLALAPTATGYTLTATATGSLAGKGTLVLDNTGSRTGSGSLGSATGWNSCNSL